MITETVLLLAAIGFVAFVARGATGAASAIIFNALFGLALALGLAGSLTLLEGLYWIALADLFATAVLMVALRDQLTVEPFVRRLLIVMVPVAVVFAFLLTRVDSELLALGLGAVLIASGLYLGLRQTLGVWDERKLRRAALPTGLAAGALSGLYGMPGPVVMIYLAHAGPETDRFRARATVISMVLSLARVITLIASGAIGSESLVRFGLSVPIIVAGLGVGLWLHPRIGPRAFRTGLGLIVILGGGILMARTLISQVG